MSVSVGPGAGAVVDTGSGIVRDCNLMDDAIGNNTPICSCNDLDVLQLNEAKTINAMYGRSVTSNMVSGHSLDFHSMFKICMVPRSNI